MSNKANLFILYIAVILLIHSSSYSQWIHNSGQPDGDINAFTSIGTSLFAGTDENGIYLSTDNGIHWNAVNNGLTSTRIQSFTISGANIFAGTFDGKVFLSTNEGANWNEVSNGLPNHPPWELDNPIWALAVSDTTLFAGTHNNGVFRSIDNGSSWMTTGLANCTITSLAVIGTYIFAGESESGVFLSTNNGIDWKTVNAGLPSEYRQINTLSVCDSNLFVNAYRFDIDEGYKGGVFLSTDKGLSWNTANLNIPEVAFGVSDAGLFVSSSAQIYFTSNNGTSWNVVSNDLTYIYINTLIINNGYLFVGTKEGIWRRPLSEITSIRGISLNHLPQKSMLQQNYPNPFNPITIIEYKLSASSHVSLKVYDELGRELRTLINEHQYAGDYKFVFNAKDLPSGNYFYCLRAGSFSTTKKFVLLK
jgi:photosystem II stability/assembly factor-like uncharacterized protein